MKPVDPQLELEGFRVKPTVYIGADPIQPLPASVSAEGLVITRWKLSDQEKAAVAAGADLWVGISTYGAPLQPIAMSFTRGDITG